MSLPNEFGCDFQTVDDSRDHCVWLADMLEKHGGEIVVRYRYPPAEQRAAAAREQKRSDLRNEIARLQQQLEET